MNLKDDARFSQVKPFDKECLLSSPTMHGDEIKWIEDAITTNWVTTVGENINTIERDIATFIGKRYAVGLSSGTAALHLAIRLAAHKLYGVPSIGHGALEGQKVFCSDMTFAATLNPVIYENGCPVFIDTDNDSWNMDPDALEKAFELYPDVRLIVVAHLYGSTCKIDRIREIANRHGALIVEDAAESFGATYKGVQTGCFGDYSVISFNGNKIITGSSGGMLLCDDKEDAYTIRKWSTQSREDAPWYQHKEVGYNYRMSNIVAGIVRGQLPYLNEHIKQKKRIFEQYKKGFEGLPVKMNPVLGECDSNHWLSCITINPDYMCDVEYNDTYANYVSENGKTCPTEILNVLGAFNAYGRPIWKPMHMQPIYSECDFVTREGLYATGMDCVGEDIFARGVCLPSDNKMTEEQVDGVVEIVKRCF